MQIKCTLIHIYIYLYMFIERFYIAGSDFPNNQS